MKLLLILIALTTNASAQVISARIGQINKEVAASGTPERISATDFLVRKAYIKAAGDNTGLVYVATSSAGCSATNGFVLTKGTVTVAGSLLELNSTLASGDKPINLKDLWACVATNGDQVNVLYIE